MSKKVKNLIKQKPISAKECIKYYNYENPEKDWNNRCYQTSLINYHKADLDMSWGTLWAWSEGGKIYKGYKPLHFAHNWNLDDYDNVYDDLESLNESIKSHNRDGLFHFKIDLNKTPYRYVDGRKFGIIKNQTIKLLRIESELNRRFKSSNPLKTPPLIYVSEVAWWESQNPKYYGKVRTFTDEIMELFWQRVEQNELMLDRQLKCA